MNHWLKYVALIGLMTLFLSACKPDMVELEVYTEDLAAAKEGEVVSIPAKVVFELLGDDEKNQLDQAKAVAEKYLDKDSKIEVSEGDMGKVMTISTTLPLGPASKLSNSEALAALSIDKGQVSLVENEEKIAQMNSELSDISFMLDFELPASETIFRVVSDSREAFQFQATAVFVDNTPYVQFHAALKRRDSAEVLFKGGDGSIYSQISPFIEVK